MKNMSEYIYVSRKEEKASPCTRYRIHEMLATRNVYFLVAQKITGRVIARSPGGLLLSVGCQADRKAGGAGSFYYETKIQSFCSVYSANVCSKFVIRQMLVCFFLLSMKVSI